MKPSILIIPAFACLSLFACGAPSPDAANATDIAPAALPVSVAATASHDKSDGTKLTIKLGDGRAVALQGFKLDAKKGLSDAQCGVTVDRQRLVTIGADETDAYTCGTLVAAGALPPAGGVQRIGLIYDVASPNAHFRTAIVLRNASGIWQVDPVFTGRFDDTPAGRSIPELRKAVR